MRFRIGEEKDACKDCIRCQKFEKQVCPKCGKEAVETTLDGPCVLLKCSCCDYEVVGASFYAPCEQDSQKYMLKIVSRGVSNQQIVELGKLLQMRVMEIKRGLQEAGYITKQFPLTQLLEVIQSIEGMGLTYAVEPKLRYSRIFVCEKRMKIY